MAIAFDPLNLTKKQIEMIIRGMLYTVMAVPGLFFVHLYWFGAAISLCGIHGCEVPALSVYNPDQVKDGLMKSGLVAAIAPLLIFFISKFKWWWLLIAIATFYFVPIIGANSIGATPDGYPINRVR